MPVQYSKTLQVRAEYLISVSFKLFSYMHMNPSGEIMCTIHSQVIEENQKELQPGAVLVLRQVAL
jgi:hypothetical protein